jgi:transcriptional regulator with XRE-family HTH domain
MKKPKSTPTPTLPIGTQIAARRKLLAITQVELASRLGTTQNQIARWEKTRTIGVADLCRMADALGVSAILDAAGPRLIEPGTLDR